MPLAAWRDVFLHFMAICLQRRCSMRVSHLIILGSLVLAVAIIILAFAGIVAIGPLNQRNLNSIVDLVVQRGSGYSPAKTPAEAMTNFREAIQNRKYKIAAAYCTKDYKEMLER